MKRFKRMAALLMAVSVVLSGCAGVELPEDAEETEAVELPPARPQDDFFRYINEKELAEAEFEYGAMSYTGGFKEKMVEDQVKEIIAEVVSGSGYEVGSEEYIIKRAYDLFYAYDFENAGVPAELDALFHEIDEISSIEEFLEMDARLDKDYFVPNILNMAGDIDYLSAGTSILSFSQYSGIMDADFETLEETYGPLNSLKDMGSLILQQMGHEEEEADEIGTQFGYIAMDIYNDTDIDVIKEPMKHIYFSLLTPGEAQEIVTNVDLDKYLKDMGIDPKMVDRYGVYDKGQLAAVNAVITEENLEALKCWKMTALANQYKRFIVYGYDKLEQYRNIDYKPKDELALDEVMMTFYDQTDPLYIDRYYSQAMDDALISMCDDIREGYRVLITNADWLSQSTRNGLLKKLDNIVYVTGSNVERTDPSVYKNLKGNDYFEFCLSYKAIQADIALGRFGQPGDRTRVGMPMQQFNACYDPSLNNITITVAIMNKPFFDLTQDYYTNLGGLGMVIAHEMGHAFDSNCILFNQNGIYDPSWIASEDMDTLLARNEDAKAYFENNFTVFGVYHVDGELTLGENYADLGAMECITSLARTQADREKLFTNFAKIWCEKRADSALLNQLEYDVHSPAVIRVNAMLSTIDAFYETYDVKEGDGMYIAPEDRISRWH
jgi:predicted metalloendopeptidase